MQKQNQLLDNLHTTSFAASHFAQNISLQTVFQPSSLPAEICSYCPLLNPGLKKCGEFWRGKDTILVGNYFSYKLFSLLIINITAHLFTYLFTQYLLKPTIWQACY